MAAEINSKVKMSRSIHPQIGSLRVHYRAGGLPICSSKSLGGKKKENQKGTLLRCWERFLGFGGWLRTEEITQAKIEMLASEQKAKQPSPVILAFLHSYPCGLFFISSLCLRSVVTTLSLSWLHEMCPLYSKSCWHFLHNFPSMILVLT